VTGSGGTQLSCSLNTSNTPTLRSEGITEQIGDIVISCTGGQIYPNIGGAGATSATTNPIAPAVNITVSLTSQVTSRLLNSSAVSEALLLIDEPNSGLAGPVPNFGPNEPFTPCNFPSATQGGCAGSNAGSLSTVDTYILTQPPVAPGVTSYQTAVSGTPTTGNTNTSSMTLGAAPNVYQGVVSGNQVTFYGVPVVPPGTNGQRVFRITNVRINASGIGGGSASGSLPVQASILTSNPSALPISNATPIVGFVQQSLSTSVAAPTSFGQCNSQTLAQTTLLTFKELFASAFKTRVDPTVTNQTAVGPGQGSALVQTKPGTIYNSESGFTLSATPASGPAQVAVGTAGLADFGTRFTAVFNNIPAGARVFVSQYGLALNTAGTAYTSDVSGGASWAQAITADTVPDGTGTIPSATQFSTTVLAPGGTGLIHVVEITPSSGNTATASWESIANSPTAIDTYVFGVYITYVASPGTNSPAAGTGTVNLRYGPASTVTTASSTANVPRFLDTSSAKNAISIGICRTILLYPFITNQAGFDTGIAISNTSTDPFGTTPQAGTCSLNWYGAAAPATATTTPSVGTATAYTALASVTVPGFQGYMIAVCNFQYAHGFAFISDVGARNLAMGYLALVVPDPNLAGGRGANVNVCSGGAIVGCPTSTGEQLTE